MWCLPSSHQQATADGPSRLCCGMGGSAGRSSPGSPGGCSKGETQPRRVVLDIAAGSEGRCLRFPSPAAHTREGLQLASLALFSTSLSTNRDQNHTNMLKSPPKLLFWFQDDAIWVPVSSLQMQAGGGERKAAETRLRSKSPARKRSCRALLSQALPGAESCSPSRCKSSAELQSLLRT